MISARTAKAGVALDLRADRSLDRGDFAGQLLQKARMSLSNKGRHLMFLLAFPDEL